MPADIRRIVHTELASWLSARSVDRFEWFTIKPPDLPEVSDFPALRAKYWPPLISL